MKLRITYDHLEGHTYTHARESCTHTETHIYIYIHVWSRAHARGNAHIHRDIHTRRVRRTLCNRENTRTQFQLTEVHNYRRAPREREREGERERDTYLLSYALTEIVHVCVFTITNFYLNVGLRN